MSIRETICVNHHLIVVYPVDSIIRRGGGELRMWRGQGVGMLVRNFELNP